MSAALLSLLQLTDSQFPSGAFAHSAGLEGLFDGRREVAEAELRETLIALLELQLLRSDCLFGLRADRAARGGNLEAICVLDRELSARKAMRELREASLAVGRSFLREVSALSPSPLLGLLRERVEARGTPGNHAIVFHVAAAENGVGARDAATAYAYQVTAQWVAALLRMGLVGHRRGQSLLAAMRGPIEGGIEEILVTPPGDDGSSFAPLLEIASMRHERQYSRLFRS
jgi:urease accessory protein